MPADNLKRVYSYFHYYALAIGVLSVSYDFGHCRVRRSRLLQIYATVLNVLTVAALPLSYTYSMRYWTFLSQNPLMQAVNWVNQMQQFTLTALITISRWQRERALNEILTQMMQLERTYFEVSASVPALVKERCDKMHSNNLLWFKYLSVFIQTVSTAYMTLFVTPAIDLNLILFCIHTTLINSVLLHTILHYFLAMWYVWERFCWLNANLQRIFHLLLALDVKRERVWMSPPLLVTTDHHHHHHMRRMRIQRHLAAEIGKMARAHWQLIKLAEHFTNCYRLQIIAVLIHKVLNNIAIGYMGFKYDSNELMADLSTFDHALTFIAFIFILTDSYLLDALCERVIEASSETVLVLKRFQELRQVDDSLEKACNTFAQQLRMHKLKISILGMIHLNKRLSFLVFGGIVKNVLLLLQWDIEQHFYRD